MPPRPTTRRVALATALAASAAAAAVPPRPALATTASAPDPAPLLARALAEAAALPRLRTLIVAREGRPLVEKAFRGPGLDRPTNIKSASKSVLSALVGVAIERRVLTGLDQTVAPVLGERVPRDADPRVRAITVGHLLSMRSGLGRTSGAEYGAFAASRDWVRHVLSRPVEAEPGERMAYSTGDTHLLSAVLTRASGRSTLDLAREWLGGPLGIAVPPWPRDPQGVYFGGNDMLLSPRALLAFAECYRLGGLAPGTGRRVVPEAWVRESWTPRARSPWSGQMYGLGWWIASARGRPVHYAWGFGGQMAYVLPDLATTVVMTSDPTGPRVPGQVWELHALLADAIVPAAEAAATTGRVG